MVFFISCGIVEKKILYPIIAGISTFICRIALTESKIIDFPLLLCLLSSLSMSLSFIPLIIIKINNPNLLAEYNHLEENNKMIKDYKKDIKIGFLLITLTSILDFINTMVNCFSNIESFTNSWAIDIVIISLFTKYSLKLDLHRHQILCIIIIILSGLLLNIIDFYNNLEKDKIIDIICVVLKEISLSLKICINRYTMDNNHMTPFEICFYEGLFEFILFSISYFIYSYFFYNSNNIFQIFIDYNNEIKNNLEIILISIIIILNFTYNLLSFLTVKYYHPCYVITIFIIQEIGSNLLKINTDNLKYYHFITILISIIFVFVFLIFNEIIEINCLGLEKNTKRNISIRSDRESEKLSESFNENNNDDSPEEIKKEMENSCSLPANELSIKDENVENEKK